MRRRDIIIGGLAAVAAGSARADTVTTPEFRTNNAKWQATYDKAVTILSGNVRTMPRYDKPILIEGAVYLGIWQECGPHESLVYRRFRPDVARNSHTTFFDLQKPDGQLPANNKLTETGFGQIQMVVPIAATAWELARATGDDALVAQTYASCGRWDDWLMKYRNTRGTGLVEGFCTYDTGHDNSPRWKGMANQCPNKDAKVMPPSPGLPRLCPDLSATIYGQRLALAEMAKALGKTSEAEQWRERAGKLRDLILAKLYNADDGAFYDLDKDDQFVKINCDVLSRMCGERIPDQAMFDTLWKRHIHNPDAYWAPYPMPSVAMNDPQFVKPIPRNSWGGATQALTALRAPRWFDHYGRSAEFTVMMDAWCKALMADNTFRQQMDPWTGIFTQVDAPGYSPACLVMIDYTWRLAGIVEQPDELWWNVRPSHPAADGTTFRMRSDGGKDLGLAYDGKGATATVAGQPVAKVTGTARLITGLDGKPKALLGIAEKPQTVTLTVPGKGARHLTLKANQRVAV